MSQIPSRPGKDDTSPVGNPLPSPDRLEDTDPISPAGGSAPPPAPPGPGEGPVPPDLVGPPRYSVLELVSNGGMGTVYKAWHRFMERMVALKIINPDLVGRPAMAERF